MCWKPTHLPDSHSWHRLKRWWTMIHKGLKIGPAILPTLRKFCILLHCQALHTDVSKQNSAKLCPMVDSNSRSRANNLPYKVKVVSPKIGAKSCIHLVVFSTSSRLNCEYLRKETWQRQSGKGHVGNYEGSHTPSRNFMNFGPQTALNGTAILPTLRKLCNLLHCQASQMDVSKQNSTQPNFATC